MKTVLALLAAVPVLVVATPAEAATPHRWSRPAVARGGMFHLRDSQSSGPATISFAYGRPGDLPLMGDWDGDGDRTPGAVRVEDDRFVWRLTNRLGPGAADITFAFGRATTPECVDDPPQCVDNINIPVVGDWNGDGRETPGVFRTWKGTESIYLRNSNTGGNADLFFHMSHGSVDGLHWVFGDWDGNGTDTPAGVSGAAWELVRRFGDAAPYTTFTYGRATDLPVVGDWDSDGLTEPGATRRVGDTGLQWLLRNSATSGGADRTFSFGRWGDVPLVW